MNYSIIFAEISLYPETSNFKECQSIIPNLVINNNSYLLNSLIIHSENISKGVKAFLQSFLKTILILILDFVVPEY